METLRGRPSKLPWRQYATEEELACAELWQGDIIILRERAQRLADERAAIVRRCLDRARLAAKGKRSKPRHK